MPDETPPPPAFDPDAATLPVAGPQPTLPRGEIELPLPEELTALLPAGNYHVESFLGQGGMGAVYKGTQVRLKRSVAIKIMRRDQGQDYGFEQRFEREAQAMAKLNHPNIVSVIDYGEAGPDYLYIVMELVDGADLMDVIRGGQMTQEMALSLLPQICDALQFAHDHGIVHRDIKPSNIMVTRDGRVKMADFGLAKPMDGIESGFRTQTGTGMGTPDYAAPEQFDPNGHIDHRADIYALGVMIYQMITGQLPRGAWKAPSERAPVAPQWDDIVSRAMQSDPSDRYQAASQIKTDVSSIVMGAKSDAGTPARKESTAAGRSARITSESPPAKSRAPLIFGLVVGAVVIALGVFFAFKKPDGTAVAAGTPQQPAPASPTPGAWKSAPPPAIAAPALPESGWKPLLSDADWKTHWPGEREFVDGRVHLIAFSLLKPMPSANGAIRARIQWREGSKNVALIAREVGQKKGNYKLTVNATGLALNVLGDEDKVLATPGLHDFAQPLEKGAVLTVELRLQDDHLTVLLDGATVITAQNSAHATAGGWGIIAGNGWFESVEVQPLPAAASTAPQTEEKWRDWLVEARDKTFFPNVFTEAGGKLVVARTGGLTWEYSLMARDMAVRATWLPADLPPLIPEVMARTATDGTGRHYAARVVDGKVHLSERRQSGGTTSTRTIQEWPLPAGFDPKADQVLELRVVADLLTVRLNGHEIGSVRDSALTHSGTAGAFATKGTVIRKLEYLNLDAPESTTASQPPASEKWQDLIAAGGWPAPWTIENGVLTRPAKTLAQRKWETGVRDCAWRVTRRWDGGWYDLQLGLRSRGNTGVRLQFLELPQPDVIFVRISSNKEKLGEGRTTRRYQKGELITIEFRAVGARITASINGELVASAEETTTTSGAYDIWTNYGDAPAFHKVEFLNLDGTAR
jgi:predicted Ser/Thr protein kinase